MPYLIENSAQAFWLIWAFIWHSLWIVVLGSFLHSIFITIRKQGETVKFTKFENKTLGFYFDRLSSKTPFAFVTALLVWHFIGLKGLFFILLGALTSILVYWLSSSFKTIKSYPAIKQNLSLLAKINYLNTATNLKQKLFFLYKEMLYFAFWEKTAQNFKQNSLKLVRPWLGGIFTAAILGAYIPVSFWYRFILSPSLWTSFPQNFLTGLISGLLVPFVFIFKLPFGIYLWNIGLPTSSFFAFLFASLVSPKFCYQNFRRLGSKKIFLILLKILIATAFGACFVQFLANISTWSFIHKAPLLQKEIAFDATFWLNSAAVLVVIGAFILANWKKLKKPPRKEAL